MDEECGEHWSGLKECTDHVVNFPMNASSVWPNYQFLRHISIFETVSFISCFSLNCSHSCFCFSFQRRNIYFWCTAEQNYFSYSSYRQNCIQFYWYGKNCIWLIPWWTKKYTDTSFTFSELGYLFNSSVAAKMIDCIGCILKFSVCL